MISWLIGQNKKTSKTKTFLSVFSLLFSVFFFWGGGSASYFVRETWREGKRNDLKFSNVVLLSAVSPGDIVVGVSGRRGPLVNGEAVFLPLIRPVKSAWGDKLFSSLQLPSSRRLIYLILRQIKRNKSEQGFSRTPSLFVSLSLSTPHTHTLLHREKDAWSPLSLRFCCPLVLGISVTVWPAECKLTNSQFQRSQNLLFADNTSDMFRDTHTHTQLGKAHLWL